MSKAKTQQACAIAGFLSGDWRRQKAMQKQDLSRTKKPNTEILAYAVTENEENTGSIIFASSGISARRIGADQYADGDFSHVTCRRAPWADDYASVGDVPASVAIKNGWHFECSGCGATIDNDWLTEKDIDVEDVIGSQKSAVYCTALCQARNNLKREEARHRQKRWIRRFKRFIRAKFPDAQILNNCDRFHQHAYASQDQDGRWRMRQVSVSFAFEGMVHGPAVLRYDCTHPRSRSIEQRPAKPYWSCCTGDKDVFEAWALHQKDRRAAIAERKRLEQERRDREYQERVEKIRSEQKRQTDNDKAKPPL